MQPGGLKTGRRGGDDGDFSAAAQGGRHMDGSSPHSQAGDALQPSASVNRRFFCFQGNPSPENDAVSQLSVTLHVSKHAHTRTRAHTHIANRHKGGLKLILRIRHIVDLFFFFSLEGRSSV